MKYILSSILFITLSLSTLSQLTIVVNQTPLNTPDGAGIYIAGNFQGWDPTDPNYILTENSNGDLEIIINPTPGDLVFKFTRGSWDYPEGNENGSFLPDRTFTYDGSPQTLELQILSWEDVGGLNSTAAENVSVLATDYYIPQLNRERRVWVYLPPDYSSAPEKHYPVLYMHDGQNIFDAATSFSGEWEVDETLNDLFEAGDYGCIVVAIDNGGQYRLDEYSPWVNTQYGGGQGDEYMQFIINTLKPDIDSNYRTRTERDYTGIMGSSMGGLISMYGGMEYSTVFSKIGSFSPAYWFADESIPHAENSSPTGEMKIYSIIGEPEGNSAVQDVNDMDEALLGAGLSSFEISSTIHSDGAHSEWYWAREFGDAYEWLFADIGLTISEELHTSAFSVYPNPSSDSISITGFKSISNIQIKDVTGRNVLSVSGSFSNIDISFLPNGKYFLEILSKDNKTEIIHLNKF